MSKKAKNETIAFDCPCDKKLSLFKTFAVEDGTPPEEILTECPMCERTIKLQLDNQLTRDQPIYRGGFKD